MNHQSAALPSLVRVIVEGASLAYTFEQGDSVRWKLYTGPISVTGSGTLRTRAVRYGWSDSAAASAQCHRLRRLEAWPAIGASTFCPMSGRGSPARA